MGEYKKNGFSKREVVLLCLFLLTALVLIATVVGNKWKITSGLFQDVYTFMTSVLCSVLAAAVLPKVLQSSGKGDIKNIIQTEMENIMDKNNVASPIKVYTDTDDPNPEFNDMLNDSIMNSHNYTYFSDRAMFTVKRLYKDIDANSVITITVFVADIRDDELFKSRKDAYNGRERMDSRYKSCRKLSTIIKQEKKDILSSIYGLSQLRDKFEISVYLHKEIPFIRFEITDTLIIMTFLNRISTGKKHPTTLVYRNESIFKPNYEEYVREIMERSYKMTDNDLTITGIMNLAKDAGIDCTEEEIIKYYTGLISEQQGGA